MLVSCFRSSSDLQGALAEALDGGEDVVGGFGPAEGLGMGIVRVDEGADVVFELPGGAMHAAPELLLREQGEEALDLIEPGCAGRGEVDVPTRPLGQPVADGLGLVGDVIAQDPMHVEVGRHVGLDLVEEFPERARAMLRAMPKTAKSLG